MQYRSCAARLNNNGIPQSHMTFPTTGLPATGSWQDLKNHMREAGDVCYVDVYKDGTGVVEFLRYEDMKYAARKLDDSKFRSHEVSEPHLQYCCFVLPMCSRNTICFHTSHVNLFCEKSNFPIIHKDMLAHLCVFFFVFYVFH